MQQADRLDVALSHWRRIASAAGLTPGDWRAAVLSSRRDARHDRVVIGLTSDGQSPLVFKIDLLPQPQARFDAAVAAHRAALARGARLPALLAVDPVHQAILQDWVPGRTAFDTCEMAPDPAQVLRIIGAGVAAFHAAGGVTPRSFHPRYTVRYLRQIMATIRDGTRLVAAPALFLAHARRFCADQPAYEALPTCAVHLHGDLHLRNLMIAGPDVVLIDPLPAEPGPPGHDLGRLLVDYAAMIAPACPAQGNRPLPGVDLDAFFDGYRIAGPDDPSIRLLCRMRLLTDWITVPADPADRSRNQTRRLDGLMRLARAAFAPEADGAPVGRP